MKSTARYATKTEIKDWDKHILDNPDGGNVFSSLEYAEQKRFNDYTPRFIIVGNIAVTVLEKQTPPMGKLWYLPKGPNVTSVESLLEVLSELKPLARKRRVFAIRIETELPRSASRQLQKRGLIPAKPIIPNPSTITLDISEPLDEVLLKLPQKGRYAIRRAQRDGVSIELVPTNEKNCQIMYDLLSQTAKGQFGIRKYEYYQTFWQRFDQADLGQLFFARYNGVVVAGAYAMTYGTKSTYKDGASIRQRTAYGASHLLQWRVIEWAKSRGVEIHDFCGSPPSDEIHNPDHPHYGIGLFKTSFNREVKDFIGCYDFVLSKTRYNTWLRVGERVYRHFYYKKTKDYYY